MSKNKSNEFYHRFLDEAGDTTFFGKGKIPSVGKVEGVSLSFILGMVKFRESLLPIRTKIIEPQKEIENDEYLKDVPSVRKKIEKDSFYFHAKDNVPEVREKFFKFIKSIDLSFEAVVGRKIYEIFANKHNSNESEFYADLFSHLIKNKFEIGGKLILNVSQLGKSTKNTNLMIAIETAQKRFKKNKPEKDFITDIAFNVQYPTTEPLLTISDYLCWAVQRVFERGDIRYYNFLEDKISLIIDLYDSSKYEGNKHYYNHQNKLTTENKLSPP
jgi:hypothetical protein